MVLTFRRVILILILGIFFCTKAFAQPQKGRFLNGNIGLGVSFPYENIDIGSTGFYAQAEYVFGIKKWFGFRPYAGFISTSPNQDLTSSNLSQFEVTTRAFLVGGKIRVAAPIPWVAPFIEFGFGASVGSFDTYTPYTNKSEKGLLYHIPYSLGLALGPKHNVEVAFTYYEHPSMEQVSGAAAIGLSFPIN